MTNLPNLSDLQQSIRNETSKLGKQARITSYKRGIVWKRKTGSGT